jgi:hypothetical protein
MKTCFASPGWYRGTRMRGLARGDVLCGARAQIVFNDLRSDTIVRSQVLELVDDRKAFGEIELGLKPIGAKAVFGRFWGRFADRLLGLGSTAREQVRT